jgi:hypothetical protein
VHTRNRCRARRAGGAAAGGASGPHPRAHLWPLPALAARTLLCCRDCCSACMGMFGVLLWSSLRHCRPARCEPCRAVTKLQSLR